MKIWILNHHARDYGRHPSLSKYLSELGNNVELYSASFLHNTFKETKDYRGNQSFIEEELDGYNRVYIKTPKYNGNGIKRFINQIVFSFRAYKIGKRKLKSEVKPDIIMGSSVHLFAGVAAYFLAKRSNAKFVFEIRDIWPQTLVDLEVLKKNSIITKIFEFIEKFLYKKADMIISVLPNGVNHIEKLGISKEKVVYLPNGIDTLSHKKALKNTKLNKDLTQYFNRHKDNFILTYTGAHGKANGLDTIVNAANLLKKDKKTQFLLVGDGPEKQKLLDMTEKFQLENITFIDRVKKDEVALILEKSNICIFHLNKTPVFKYGISSNKLFDYMISGKPMIFAVETSSNFSLLAKNGISIEPENPKALVNAIETLQKNDNLTLSEMGNNGKNYVENNHDFKKLANDLNQTFKKMI